MFEAFMAATWRAALVPEHPAAAARRNAAAPQVVIRYHFVRISV
jgi:hypothetical protein